MFMSGKVDDISVMEREKKINNSNISYSMVKHILRAWKPFENCKRSNHLLLDMENSYAIPTSYIY